LPQDDGSHRSRCPPSHHKMALRPYFAQASAQAPRPSPPSTHSPVLPGKVSPHHQQGSTMPSAAPAASPSCHLVSSASMGGGSPHTRPHDRSYGLMAPSPATTEAAKPSPSSAHPFLPTRSSPTHPLPTMGGVPPRRQAVLCLAVTSVWHLPCLHSQYLPTKIQELPTQIHR
jgi:hypothetical protein